MDLVGGGVDSRGGYVSKILYVKTKELGPLGGGAHQVCPLDPPMSLIAFPRCSRQSMPPANPFLGIELPGHTSRQYDCLPKGRHSEGPHEIPSHLCPKLFQGWGGVGVPCRVGWVM